MSLCSESSWEKVSITVELGCVATPALSDLPHILGVVEPDCKLVVPTAEECTYTSIHDSRGIVGSSSI